MIELWLVRHGETDWNVQARIQGWTDIPLNRAGITQAQTLAHWLEGIPFRIIFVSDLSRARTTATLLQHRVHAPLHETRTLRERNFGAGEGLLRHDAMTRYPDGYPGAETDDELSARARQFLDDCIHQVSSGRVLAVAHGGIIRSLLTLMGWPAEPAMGNTSVSRARWDGTEWRITAVNWTAHIEADRPADGSALAASYGNG